MKRMRTIKKAIAWLMIFCLAAGCGLSYPAEVKAESVYETVFEAQEAASQPESPHQEAPAEAETTVWQPDAAAQSLPETEALGTEPAQTGSAVGESTQAELTEEPAQEQSAEEKSTQEQTTEEKYTEKFTEEESMEEGSTQEESMEEGSMEEGSTQEESMEEGSTEEGSMEEESTEEESAAEEIPEDDIERLLSSPVLLDLGDVTSVLEITSCMISGNSVLIKGKTNTPFTTWNKKLFLFEEEMYRKDISGEPIAEISETDDFSFEIPFSADVREDRLYSKFYVGVQLRNGEYFALSEGRFITNPEALAENQSAFPAARSKKGILAENYWGTDLDELGISHANVNIVINEMFDGEGISYTYNGKSYTFSREYIEFLDGRLRLLQQNSIVVYAVLLARPGAFSNNFTYPGISQSVGAYHGWNVVTEEGIDTVSAVLHFLGERYGRSDGAYGHIAGWIVGNEVNADTSWNYMGHPAVSVYALDYANMMRITYQAVKSSCAHARVYMSLDMYWNNSASPARYDGRRMIDLVNTYLKAEGDISWGVAFHPYANPLTEPEFWNDHAEQSANAGFISMQNISVLTDYLKRSTLRDPDGSVRKVILSEQGYTSYSSNQGNVEWKQAAAYAYAYYITEANPYIQAFVAMRQKDADLEADGGLHQGLWYDNTEKDIYTFAKKPVWTVWKYIDTAQSFAYTDSLASIVGLSSFSGLYQNVMASYGRTVISGQSGYTAAFTNETALGGSWSAEYLVSSLQNTADGVKVTAGANSPFAYSSIQWQGTADFSSRPIFGFDFTGTAGADQNLRVRMRFTSGQDVYDTEIAVKRDTQQRLYADLSGWAGRFAVSKIQIWVQQDGVGLWENGSFTASGFCMAAGVSTQQAPSIAITEAAATGSESGFDVSCKVSGTQEPARVEYCAWNVQAGTSTAVTKNGSVSQASSSAHFSVSEFGGRTGAYQVRIVAYDSDGLASKETTVSVTVKGSSEALVVTNGYISNISASGFRITFEAKSDYGLSSSSQVAVWSSDGGQDDLQWYTLMFTDGVASVDVKTADHKYSSGEYICHGYIRDNGGNTKLFPLIATVTSVKPQVVSASVTDVSSMGYTVTCKFDCPKGVKSVQMPTWTEKNGQDDIRWYSPAVSGSTATFYVRTRDHNKEAGLYHTHIYVYDNNGQYALRALDIRIPEDTQPENLVPSITNAKTSELTGAGYRVTVTFSSPAIGVKQVQMPTWTEKNGQDDIRWYTAPVKGNTATFYVPVSDHNNETGKYITHIYVTDKLDQQADVVGVEVIVPGISGLVNTGGYRYEYWKDGVLDTGFTSLIYYNGAWFYVEKGVLNWDYTGLVCYNGSWFYVEKGVINWSYTSLAFCNGSWFYVEKGVLDWGYTGLAYYSNYWFYVEKGVVKWSYTGLTCYRDTWFYVEGGVLDWSYTGLAYYNSYWFYVEKGILNWKFTGTVQQDGKEYYVENGVAGQ